MVDTILNHLHKTNPWRFSWIEQQCTCPIIVWMTWMKRWTSGNALKLFSYCYLGIYFWDSISTTFTRSAYGISCSLGIIVVNFRQVVTATWKVFFPPMVLVLWATLSETSCIEQYWCFTRSGIFVPQYAVSMHISQIIKFQHATT